MIGPALFVQAAILATVFVCLHAETGLTINHGHALVQIYNRHKRQLSPVEQTTENLSVAHTNQTDTRTHSVNSILFGDYCYLIRLIFFMIPLYFCPTTTTVEYNVTSHDQEEGEEDKSFAIGPPRIEESPIDLTPAKPKRPPSITPPPTNHGHHTQNSILASVQNYPSSNSTESTAGRQPVSKCTRAIAECCRPGSSEINQGCFEEKECPGLYWDNPCTTERQAAARQAVGVQDS